MVSIQCSQASVHRGTRKGKLKGREKHDGSCENVVLAAVPQDCFALQYVLEETKSNEIVVIARLTHT